MFIASSFWSQPLCPHAEVLPLRRLRGEPSWYTGYLWKVIYLHPSWMYWMSGVIPKPRLNEMPDAAKLLPKECWMVLLTQHPSIQISRGSVGQTSHKRLMGWLEDSLVRPGLHPNVSLSTNDLPAAREYPEQGLRKEWWIAGVDYFVSCGDCGMRGLRWGAHWTSNDSSLKYPVMKYPMDKC